MVSVVARARRAAHLVDRFVEVEAVKQFAVDVGDIVAGLDPGLVGGRVLGRGDNLDRAVLDGDRQADPAVIAVRGGLQLAVVAALHVGAVRVERGQHAVDGALDQGVVVDRVDVGRAHLVEHVHERVQFLHGVGVGCRERAGRHRDQGERTHHGEGRKEPGEGFHRTNPY